MATSLKSVKTEIGDNKANPFIELSAIDVNEHVEKKNGFSYLSWPFAITEILKRDYDAEWKIKRHDGNPYLKTDCGYFVEVEVIYKGKARECLLPVLDHSNKPIPQPNAFQINTSIQRCLVKCCSFHGIGLYLYAGEDLPLKEPEQKMTREQHLEILIDMVATAEESAFKSAYETAYREVNKWNDVMALAQLIAAKDVRKAQLEKETA